MSLDFMLTRVGTIEIFSANQTHNVGSMWRLAGVYSALYESEGQKAASIINTLREGVARMEDNKPDYVALNPSNGWGSYDTALKFLKSVLAACVDDPGAKIRIWR